MPINLPQVPFKLTPQDMGVANFDFGQALRSGFDTFNKFQEARYKPKTLSEALLASQLANKINTAKAKYAEQNEAANLAQTQANTGLLGQNTYKQKILNEFLPQREKAEIGELGARSNYYNLGGGGSGVGQKNQQAYINQVKKDNPSLSDPQVLEAANAYMRGENILPDGTELNPITPLLRNSIDLVVKAGSTAQGINTANAANAADAELEVFSDLSKKWSQPYANTYFGYSPQQIIDATFSKDPKVQKQLGQLIASNALQFEIAQIRNRIAGGAPGITSTQELMKESKQYIDTQWPKMSADVRKTANDALNEAVQSGLQARNKMGYGAAASYAKQFASTNEGRTTTMYKNGIKHAIPKKDEKEALKLGYSYAR